VNARVEQRDDTVQLLCEDAVRFDANGPAAIKAKLDERRAFLARKQRFAGTPRNGRGNGNGSSTGNGNEGSAYAPPPAAPSVPAPEILVRSHYVPEILVRFRVALDYERSLALFQRIQVVLVAYPGTSPVALELPRTDGAARRLPTPFRAQASEELSAAIAREVGDVVEVVVAAR
jgi:hypothetical protein